MKLIGTFFSNGEFTLREIKLIGATFSDGALTVTLFKQDIEEMDRICQVPDFLAVRARQQFAAKLAARAVFNDTGEALMDG